MSEREPDLPPLRLEVAAVAAATTTLQHRAQTVLEVLGRILPFDAAWLAVRDPEQGRHTPLATTGPAEPLRRYFLTLEADAELDQLDLNRRRPPMLVAEIPIPLPELRAWAEHLLPAGFRGVSQRACSPGPAGRWGSSACSARTRTGPTGSTGGSSPRSPRSSPTN